ncbi:MAG: hypothetical protein AAFP19_04010 [Bacteroidota bacterium]
MKSKTLNLFVLALFLSALIISCSKDDIHPGRIGSTPDSLSSMSTSREGGDMMIDESCTEDLGEMTDRSAYKVVFARFIAEYASDQQFKGYFFNQLYQNHGPSIESTSNEFFIAEHLNDQIALEDGSSLTLESRFGKYLEQNYPQYLSLLSKMCLEFYDVVVDLPWYGEKVIQNYYANQTLDKLKFGAFGQTSYVLCNEKSGNILYTEDGGRLMIGGATASINYMPLAVKDAEENIVFTNPNDLGSYIGDNFEELLENSVSYRADHDYSNIDFSQFIKTLTCSGHSIFDLIKLNNFITNNTSRLTESDCGDCLDNDGDGLVDCFDPDCNCDPKEICNNGMDDDCDGLVDQDDPSCPCIANCTRDCIKDATYLKAIAFPRPSSLYWILGPGENLIDLNYDFVNVSICDPFNSITCPSTSSGTINKLFSGIASQFFFPQGPWQWYEEYPSGPQPSLDVDGVYYIEVRGNQGERIFTYWKAWPKYVEVDWLMMGEWNGNAIGDQIKYSIVEYDGVSLNSNYTTQVQSTVSNQLQAGASSGSNPGQNGGSTSSQNASYTFSTGITNTVTVQHSLRYEKDRPLGEYRMFYCDENKEIPDPFGYTDNWYGFIPDRSGNLQLEQIIDLFEIK